MPTNQGYKWFGSCPDPFYNETNWEGNVIPGFSDDAVLGVEYGAILVNGHAQAMSVNAQGGLDLDVPSYSLELGSGVSTIYRLRLYSSASVHAGAGVTVNLEGASRIRSDIYGPGAFTNTADLNLNYGRMWENCTIINQNTATLTGPYFQMGDGNSTFINNGSFSTSSTASEIRGAGSIFTNNGTLSINYSGAVYFNFSPNYQQMQNASLIIQAGDVRMRSLITNFYGGTVTVNTDAVLEHTTDIGGEQEHRISGPTTLNGGGWILNNQEVIVDSPLTISMGSGDANTGSGGYRLMHSTSPMVLNRNVTNTGRFQLYDGLISGIYVFNNSPSGWIFTTSTRSGTFESACINRGNIQLSSGITLNNSFFNQEGTITVLAGDIRGSSDFSNHGMFLVNMTNPDDICNFSPYLSIESKGVFKIISGHLCFEHTPGIAGLLMNTHWIAYEGTTVCFPESITAVLAASLTGKKESFENVELQTIGEGGQLNSDMWSTVGDLFLDSGNLEVQAGDEGVSVNGTLSATGDSSIRIEPDSELNANQVNLNAPIESAVPELTGIVVLAKADAVAPKVITPLLNNHGRIRPGGHGEVGPLHLVGNLVQYGTGELGIDLGGDGPGVGYDQLSVEGDATLNGLVNIHRQSGFWPAVGQEFIILTVSGTITGTFEGITTPPPGTSFSLRHEPHQVVLVTEASDPTPAPAILAGFALNAAYPNPFNPRTTIGFDLPGELSMELIVYDVSGRLVRKLVNGIIYAEGHNEISWDGRNDEGAMVPAGVYFYQLTAENNVATRRMTLIK